MVVLIFVAAFATLAISFWPYIIPFTLTIDDAAAPQSSLAFMFWGEGLFVFPLLLLYSVISYRVPSRMWLEFVWRNLRYDESYLIRRLRQRAEQMAFVRVSASHRPFA